MKYLALLAQFMLFMILVPIPAQAQNGQDCVALSAGLGPQDRTNFLRGCLGKKSSPVSVEEAAAQRRILSCEQNAKNKSLQGKESADYVDSCMAEIEAKAKWAKVMGKNGS